MLQIKNLSITHTKDMKSLISNFSFALNPGDKAVIIGEEGNGKSTMLKWIYDPDLTEDYTECSGERAINNERLAYLPQELPENEQNITVYEFFSQSSLYQISPKELSLLASHLSLRKDIYYSEQLMKQLSGGEKIKVQLLRLLIDEPTVLLLDEPSNDIDLKTLEWLERFIQDFPGIVLFISHDEVLIEHTANVVIHIEQVRRKTVSRCTFMRTGFAEYAAMRKANLQNQEALALNQRRQIKKQEEKFRKIYEKVSNDQNNISRQDPHSGRLLKKKMHAVKSLEHRYERQKEEAVEVPDLEEAMYIRFDNKSRAIPAGKTVLDISLEKLMCPDGQRPLAENIRLILQGNEKVCIIGENGTGKSTLIRIIAEILLVRDDIIAMYMPQNYADLINDVESPVQFLSEKYDKEEQTRIRTYLGSMKYTAEEMDHQIAELSGGQKAKLILLKLSMSDANVLILDEPTRNLSPLSGPVVRHALKNFPGAMISVSHDRRFIEEVCDSIYELTPDGLKKHYLQ